MGKTKFGTKIVFFFVILLGAGAVLYAKNCMEQLAAYAVSLMDGAEQAQAQSQLAAMISLWVQQASLITSGALTLHAAIRTPSPRAILHRMWNQDTWRGKTASETLRQLSTRSGRALRDILGA